MCRQENRGRTQDIHNLSLFEKSRTMIRQDRNEVSRNAMPCRLHNDISLLIDEQKRSPVRINSLTK